MIGASYDVYNELGYGFLESVYTAALPRELQGREHRVSRELAVRIHYRGEYLCTLRMDLVVDDHLIVEVKAGSSLPPITAAQTFSYLRATNFEVALILHIGPKPEVRRLTYPNTSQRTSAVITNNPQRSH